MNSRMIRNILGWLLIFECGFMTVPVITALVYKEAQIWYFLIAMLLCLLMIVGCFVGCGKKAEEEVDLVIWTSYAEGTPT